MGSCVLREPANAALLTEAMHPFDDDRYETRQLRRHAQSCARDRSTDERSSVSFGGNPREPEAIQLEANQCSIGKQRGSAWPIDVDAYKERSKVERLVNKMKQFRRVATRYEKLKDSF
jgi:hypothetical protein